MTLKSSSVYEPVGKTSEVEVRILMTAGEYQWLCGVVKNIGAPEWKCMRLFLKVGALCASCCAPFVKKEFHL